MMAIEDEHEVPINEAGRKPLRTLAQMKADSMSKEGDDPWGCPSCGCRDLRVTNTWLHNGSRKRLRKCRNCGTPATTIEKFEY